MNKEEKIALLKNKWEGVDGVLRADNLDRLKKGETFLFLALVVDGVKKGSTFRVEMSDEKNVESLIKKLGLFFRKIEFKGGLIFDVAVSKEHLNEKRWGEFYSYPKCCTEAYEKHMAKHPELPMNYWQQIKEGKKSNKDVWSALWVGLVPCRVDCKKALTLSRKYTEVLRKIMNEGELKALAENTKQ